MLTGAGRSLTWTSFDMPASITRGTATDTFLYDAYHERFKKTGPDGTTIYLSPRLDTGTHYEKVTNGTLVSHKHYIYAGNRPIAIYTQRSTGVNDTRYLHADHLGSITVVTNETGSVVERLSYDPFGKRRNVNGSDATTALTSTQSRHGYTEHEHLDEVGLIHMNGRVYDPTLGRFASADPFVSRPANTQSFNRYSYVHNNPLKYIDPSGYMDVYTLDPNRRRPLPRQPGRLR